VHRIHESRVSGDGPSHDIGRILEINNDNVSLLAHLIADADELLRLHGQRSKPDGLRVDTEAAQLRGRRTTKPSSDTRED
jgi:hypothetical protein